MSKKKCARCSSEVEPSSWYRLTSGYILCGSCWFKSETIGGVSHYISLYRDHAHAEKIFKERK